MSEGRIIPSEPGSDRSEYTIITKVGDDQPAIIQINPNTNCISVDVLEPDFMEPKS